MLTLEAAHEIEHLGLNGYIESRDRFVGHDEPRPDSQSTTQPDTLTLAARELVRILAGRVWG